MKNLVYYNLSNAFWEYVIKQWESSSLDMNYFLTLRWSASGLPVIPIHNKDTGIKAGEIVLTESVCYPGRYIVRVMIGTVSIFYLGYYMSKLTDYYAVGVRTPDLENPENLQSPIARMLWALTLGKIPE